MKMNQSTEQAVFVMLMLALQKGHKPVRSSTLASVLNVSDSYLKKILKTMVNADLIQAIPGREGGYLLRKPISEFTLGDVFTALETFEPPTASTVMARAVYPPSDHLEQSIQRVTEIYDRAASAYIDQLHQLQLSELVLAESLDNGLIEWNSV